MTASRSGQRARPPAAPPAWRLRRAQPGDVAALAALYAAAARQLGPQVYSAAQVTAWVGFGADTPAFRDYVLGPRTWIAADAADGRPLGFCGVDAAGEVRSLYVRPELTRRGIGGMLLAHALADARVRGLTRFTAWATPFSRPLFEGAGLRLVAVVDECFHGERFDRLRMASDGV